MFAFYGRGLAGAWRRTYVISAVISLYLNVFVLVAQLFMKVPRSRPWRHASEPPFLATQVVVWWVS